MRFRVFLIAAVLVLAVPGCSRDDTPANAVAPSAALPTEIPAGTKLVVADQQGRAQNALRASGQLDKLPFQVEFANFIGGPAILEAFRAGAADVAGVGDVPPIHALVAGQDVPIIAALQSDPNNTPLVTAPGRAITDLAGLKGRKIAYAEGTAQQAIVLRALAKAGLTTADVELVRLQLAEFPDAVRNGQVDVAPLNEPNLTRVLGTAGTAKIPVSATDGTGTGLSYVYARRESLADPAKAAALRAYVAAYLAAFQWTNTHQDEWVQRYYVEDQKITAEAGKRIVDSLGAYVFPHIDQQLVDKQQATIDVIDRAGELPKKVRAADGFDLRFDEIVTKTVGDIGARFDRGNS